MQLGGGLDPARAGYCASVGGLRVGEVLIRPDGRGAGGDVRRHAA